MVMSKEYYAEYREKNREVLREKERKRRKENPEAYKEYNKKYYEKNKDKIIAHQLEKVYCECCDHWYRRSMLSTHKRTNKHINNFNLYGNKNGNTSEVCTENENNISSP